MRSITKPVLAAGIALMLLSCGNDTMDSAKDTPIDSTNIHGTPPADYQAGGAGNPHATAPPDPSVGALNTNAADSLQRNTEPTGHGTNTSNTTDRRTTSGSANQGDADKDIKR